MVDRHRHCACNGVWLCGTCHRWVHAHPFIARSVGLIISRHVPEPGTQPTTTNYGTVRFSCDGGYLFAVEEER